MTEPLVLSPDPVELSASFVGSFGERFHAAVEASPGSFGEVGATGPAVGSFGEVGATGPAVGSFGEVGATPAKGELLLLGEVLR
jgi:hypothetical protein